MAVEWKWLDRRPCRLKTLGENPGRIIALNDDQCAALMRAGIDSADSFCWLFVAFGPNTAMRHSEILAARFDNIDFEQPRLFVPDAKAGQRVQPITRELAEILRAEREMREDRAGGFSPRSTRTAVPSIGPEWTTRFEAPWCVLGSTPNSSPARDAPHRDHRACASGG